MLLTTQPEFIPELNAEITKNPEDAARSCFLAAAVYCGFAVVAAVRVTDLRRKARELAAMGRQDRAISQGGTTAVGQGVAVARGQEMPPMNSSSTEKPTTNPINVYNRSVKAPDVPGKPGK